MLFGFGIAGIPLLAAFLFTASLVDDLTRSGREGIVRAAEVVEQSRLLVEQSDAIERHARQFLVLDDPAVFALYRERRDALHASVLALRALSLSDAQRLLLSELESRDNELFRLLQSSQRGPRYAEVAQSLFVDINSLARGIMAESGQLIGRNVDALNQRAERVHRMLFWESVALVPIVLALGAVLAMLILRPLRSLSDAIERMGSGHLDRAVAVGGPLDLQRLGERLEWMRCRLIELENQKTLFLRNISHELKTPLTTLREGTQLLGEEVSGKLNREQREIVDLLGHNTRLLQRMIEDLLQFSSAQSALLPLQGQPLDLAELVTQAIEEHRLPLYARQLRADVNLVPLVVNGDRAKLKAVIGNLLSNAIRFSPPDSAIQIHLQKQPDSAVLDIRDKGPGIEPGQRERIFEAFYRASPMHDGAIEGSGLGLFIAREFVRMHEGTINVMETTHGAHFRVRLPLPVATVEQPGQTAAGAGPGRAIRLQPAAATAAGTGDERHPDHGTG